MPNQSGPIPAADRVSHFSYAIRNIVVEAQRVEATGMKVRYLNIGDPVAFGFAPPMHLVEAVEREIVQRGMKREGSALCRCPCTRRFAAMLTKTRFLARVRPT